MADAAERGQWHSRLGFVLAAAGSAVGLGNIWKFPYITGENGGGFFVLIYLGCVALVGLPIMTAEILLGRAAQRSPVGAFRKLSASGSPWVSAGFLGVAAAFVILSYYSIVAGWALHYTWLSISGALSGKDSEAVGAVFGELYQSPGLNLFWHALFMGLTMVVVWSGVQRGIERWARVLMPAMFIALLAMLVYCVQLPGFGPALDFVFGAHSEKLTAASVLEALGHSFFTLSLGMGAMLTYGSYFDREGDAVKASLAIGLLDTAVALLACMVLFPITFSHGMEAAAGPGLVFKGIPMALGELPFGRLLSTIFFALLVFAALTSAISLLEVTTAYLIDERGWPRRRATLVTGTLVALLGVPSALSGSSALFGSGLQERLGRNWFDFFDYLASNWMLPLGGMLTALFVGYRLDAALRQEEFLRGTTLGSLYRAWLGLLRYLVPVGMALVFLNALGVL
ncbi:MAG: sodium-dependent transporter [Myxococcales bacterium]|nr:sodium-dependent transporter [Myxococcales bacterium]